MKLAYLIVVLAALICSVYEPTYAQSRMRNTKSTSEILRRTNPPSINSIGRIEGSEVRRDQIAPKNPVPIQDYAEPTPAENVDGFLDEYFEDAETSKNIREF